MVFVFCLIFGLMALLFFVAGHQLWHAPLEAIAYNAVAFLFAWIALSPLQTDNARRAHTVDGTTARVEAHQNPGGAGHVVYGAFRTTEPLRAD